MIFLFNQGLYTPGSPATLTRAVVLASSNAGNRLDLDGSTYSVFCPIDPVLGQLRRAARATTYTAGPDDLQALHDYTGSTDRTWTLPEPAKLGARIVFYGHYGSGGVLTLSAPGGASVNGGASIKLRPGMVVALASDGISLLRSVGGIGWIPNSLDLTDKTVSSLTLLNALLTGTVYGSAIGIGPEQLVVNRNLGALAYLTTLPHSMLDKGSAGDLLIHDADGYGARLGIGTTGQSLEISGGLPAWQTRTKIAQRATPAETGAMDSTTLAIPNDDTIPQSGEGKQCTALDVTITPKASGNKLVGEVILNVSGSTALVLIASVVKNGVASALTAGAAMVYGNNELTQIKMSYEITAGSTSSQTFQIWFGSATNGQTMYINGANGNRKFGGAYISSHKITEYWV